MGHRRQAREAALQMWYEIDQAHVTPAEVVATFWPLHPAGDDIRAFADELVWGIHDQREAIDALLSQYSTHWRLPRMAAVDRNILRIATYELLHCTDIPVRVTLNEAIEIGKKFGTEESGAFINGILDQIAKTVAHKPQE